MPISISNDFVVNTTTTDDHKSPATALLSDGRMVAVYTSADGFIYAQFFGLTGELTAEMPISLAAATGTGVSVPSVTALVEGGFAVAWGSDSDVKVGTFSATGANTSILTVSGANRPTITTLADGRLFVTEYLTGSTELVYTIYNSDLTGPVTGSLATNAVVDATDKLSSATVLSDGRFVAVWQSSSASGEWDVAGQVFNADGTKSGTEFVVNTTLTDKQGEARVMALSNGGYVVSWSSGPAVSSDLVARVYTATGVGGAEFAVNSTTANQQNNSDVVQLADGRLMFVWASNEGGTSFDIRARVINLDGTPSGDDFVVNSTTAGSQVEPDVKMMADGRILVSWQSPGTTIDIRSAVIDPSTFYGTSGADSWKGGALADRLYGVAGADAFDGGAGDDLIYGGDDIDTIHGDDGNDVISGDAGNDKLFGDAGNDRINGGAGDDEFNGGIGDDVIYGSSGSDKYIGGLGTDTLSFYNGAAVTVSLATAAGSFGGAAAGDSLGTSSSIENIHGSLNGGDTLTGNSSVNKIYGFGGNDTIDGNTGNDTLDGGLGNDTIEGGSGNDIILGGAGNDNITGGTGSDTVIGGAGSDTMDGGTGSTYYDVLSYLYEATGAKVSLEESITVSGSALGDTVVALSFENLYGSNIGADTLYGSSVKNLLRGYGGNDTMYGRDGDDKMEGGDGNDTLNGGAGKDYLVGGFGNDIYVGGDGVDTIVGGTGLDFIRFNALSEIGDNGGVFDIGDDTIQLEGSVFGGLAAATEVAENRLEVGTSSTATAAATRFIFETDTGILWFDADGTGSTAAVEIIDFSKTTASIDGAFTNADIQII